MRKRILTVNFYDILHVNHGGGSFCVRGLQSALSKWFDITLVSYHDEYDIYSSRIWINKNLCVASIPKPDTLRDTEKRFYREEGFEKVDIFFDPSLPATRYYADFVELMDPIYEIAADSDILITEHPYTYRLLKQAAPGKCIWYRAHNVEYDYKNKAWQHCESKEALLNEVYDLEKECCDGCDLILTITEKDAERFHMLYNVPKSKLLNISAGIDTSFFVLPSEREKLSMDYEESAFFISSYAEASADAARRVSALAIKTPNIMYYIAGSVCGAIKQCDAPGNLCLLGMISDEQKIKYLIQADFALNLIDSGSGMNIKMLEYFAYGLPTITTEFGLRGISAKDGTHCITTCLKNVEDTVKSFCEMGDSARDTVAKNAYELVKSDYSWNACVDRILNHLSESNKDFYEAVVNSTLNDMDKDADADTLELNLDRSRKYFIFGAGWFGAKCREMLSSLAITPIGFIDNNSSLWGSMVKKIPIYPPSEYFKASDANIIIAAGVSFTVDILCQLVDSGIPLANIFLAFDGVNLYSCGKRIGYNPDYYDVEKLLKFGRKRRRENGAAENHGH
ncbi:MAG: glycosyltransferase [Oscillospiraceae bacterium]|nr:glycosyltransferase [Oscillospiraceae bacterium]